jgi:Icc-related predicted phosphoesterase
MKISLISDTHTKHNQLKNDLPGGDLLIHAGDFMNSGYDVMEAMEFFRWFDGIDNYNSKILISGNHDRWMQDKPEEARGILTGYKTIDYIQDEECTLYFDGPNGDYPEDNIHIYGSPWQPEFFNWAFNLPRNGVELQEKWSNIPTNTDILVCHAMPWGHLDVTNNMNVGCELLRFRVDEIKPKIFVGGHIHSGYGYKFDGHTHFFNASVLNERYIYSNLPFTFEWNPDTNEINWL